MKKLLSLLLCVMIVISFGACGKKDEGPKNSAEIMQSEKDTAEDKNNKAEPVEDKNEESSSDTKVLAPSSAEELESKVDEFNTTEDPERKEELRKELEEFLKQAEAMAQ